MQAVKLTALISLFSAGLPAFGASAGETQINEVLVNAEFRPIEVLKLAGSVSVFAQADIERRGALHLEQLFNLSPNVNYASGASRGRFIQIRGIGERSQFIEPRNPSVGILIDGIDFSSIGTAATTLDIKQVEVLRGPQGTLFGANALAGMVNMVANDPTETLTGKLAVEVGDYDTRTASGVLSGPLSETLGYRVALQNNRSDGYIENDFLNTDDTNNIDEQMARGKLVWQASANLTLGFTAFYADIDNGYDAFSLDNTRTTLSDNPGHDRQETKAGALTMDWRGPVVDVQATLSHADSDLEYGYDEDWAYDGFHIAGYNSVDNYQRDNRNTSVDIRLLSPVENGGTEWVAGIYFRDQDVTLLRNTTFASDYQTENAALYGQLGYLFSEQLKLIVGLRYEERDVDYDDIDLSDINNPLTSAFSLDENFWGGRIALEYQLDEMLFYGLISRGYKAGGVNSNPEVPVNSFDAEYQWNYEIGAKGIALDSRLTYQLALFYQDREDVQAKQSIFDPDNFSFNDYLTNAASGASLGLELSADYQATEQLQLFANLGLLDAEFRDFETVAHVDARNDFTGTIIAPVDLDGRDVAHAPNYQFQVGAQLAITENVYAVVDVEGKDAFFFSNSHNQKSTSYELVNARIGYRTAQWDVSLWGKNLGDEEYFVRGFYFSNQFGNDPRDGYAPNTYVQFGEPRMVGVSASYTF